MSETKETRVKFWDRDADTIIYTMMCIVTIPAIALGLFYLWAVQTYLPENVKVCTMRLMLGIYCPGCGGTRAFQSMFRGDLLRAIYYNPAAVYGVGLYVIYFVSQTCMRLSRGKLWGMKLRPIYLYIMLALMVVNCLVRNVLLLGWGIETL